MAKFAVLAFTALATLINALVIPQSTTSQVVAPSFWTGANSYFLHAYQQQDRIQVLDALKSAGMSTLRIFISYTDENRKHSASIEMPDVEPDFVGVYNDTQLLAIDQLMVEAHERNIKLIIAMHDRYALGFWSTDSYAVEYDITKEGHPWKDNRIADASKFYDNTAAAARFDNRLRHIIQHRNLKMGGRRWVDIPEAIYALEAQNEPFGHYKVPDSKWMCDRAQVIHSQLPYNSPILISTGGGITTSQSLMPWSTECAYHDIIAVHDYGRDAQKTAHILEDFQREHPDRIVLFEEWGTQGGDKAKVVGEFVDVFHQEGLPMMYWQINRPGKGDDDFEVWTDEPAWESILSHKGVNV